ncbi:phytanoyl-CoA dioxygenase family protein [Zymoseptoria brevis]|uniref:Phytanoyl-CoA dioxygenase family protein n=1 Tax=Zymoseptoria brevis TaxID=1047168 RepID=A0A0F4GJ17_9PEZI|nr:phytanoyl-CoA dioxygenase family protein [Zymoseptoria brevis]
MPPTTFNLKEDFDREGYVIVPSGLTSAQLEELRNASKNVAALARAGQWPHIRTLPRQFPPWPSDPSHGIWGVQHLMHPDLPGHKLFTSTYFSDKIIETVRELMGGCAEDKLVLELYNLLVRPDEDFELRWHRDDIPATATPEEQMARLSKPAFHAQWNCCLYDDASLIVVPQSHRRSLTNKESNADPLEINMPSQLAVQLKAGDIVFYNNNILHRGVYRSDAERMTLHGSIGHVDGGPLRARNVLQHGRNWIGGVDFSQVENPDRARGMRERLLELGKKYEEVGFAHDE